MSLEDERRRATISSEELTALLIGKIIPGTPLERLRTLKSKLNKIPELNYSLEKYVESRSAQIERGLRQGVAMKEVFNKENLSEDERRVVMSYYPELTSHIIHYDLFMSALEIQSSEEQRKYWVPKAEKCEILGCYAQTELGHGSNVRGIETRATYEPETDGFILNTPSFTACKWWVGGLGVASTHALVVARLIIKDVDYGPHAFIVQIRSMKTHEPLPGIFVGDIGPKLGSHSIDNGFLRFEFFRIPREAMLNRFARVKQGGEYEIIDPNALKILYFSLVKARANLAKDSWHPLCLSLTIAIRYSLVRRQFGSPSDPKKELQILDYQIQQHKLFTCLARLFALVFAGSEIKDLYEKCRVLIENGDDSRLGELHGIVSIFKGFATSRSLEATEICRRSCGGHGYLMVSGLPSIYANYLPSITYDGDNSILILQGAKYVMSRLRHAKKGEELPPKLKKILEATDSLQGNPSDPYFHQVLFDAAARSTIYAVFEKERKLHEAGHSIQEIWSFHLQHEGIEAAEALYLSITHQAFLNSIQEVRDPSVSQALEQLRVIFAVSELTKWHPTLLRQGMEGSVVDSLTDLLHKAYGATRPNALALIEAFEIPDQTLNSVIGKREGNIYPSMLWTSKYLNPVNNYRVFPGVQKVLKPKI